MNLIGCLRVSYQYYTKLDAYPLLYSYKVSYLIQFKYKEWGCRELLKCIELCSEQRIKKTCHR